MTADNAGTSVKLGGKLPAEFVPVRFIGAPGGQLPTPEQYAEMYARDRAATDLMNRAMARAVEDMRRIDPEAGVRQMAMHFEGDIAVVVLIYDAREAPITLSDDQVAP